MLHSYTELLTLHGSSKSINLTHSQIIPLVTATLHHSPAHTSSPIYVLPYCIICVILVKLRQYFWKDLILIYACTQVASEQTDNIQRQTIEGY